MALVWRCCILEAELQAGCGSMRLHVCVSSHAHLQSGPVVYTFMCVCVPPGAVVYTFMCVCVCHQELSCTRLPTFSRRVQRYSR